MHYKRVHSSFHRRHLVYHHWFGSNRVDYPYYRSEKRCNGSCHGRYSNEYLLG